MQEVNINKIMKKLILCAGILIFIIIVYAFINPLIFFPNHASQIKLFFNKKSNYTLEFSSLTGNLINGFKIKNLEIDDNNIRVAEAKYIHFHPNFTSIFLEQIILGKVIMPSSAKTERLEI